MSDKVESWKSKVHESVKNAIRKSGKRQIDLAADLGIGQSRLSYVLHQESSKLSFEALLDYAEKLGLEAYFSVDQVTLEEAESN